MNPLAGPAGPGKFSTRPDQLTLPSSSYGEGVQTAAIKAGAPLARTVDVRGTTPAEIRQAASQGPVTPLYAPTQRPDEPITQGIAMGPGAGPEILGMNQVNMDRDKDFLAKYIPMLQTMAASPDASESFRIFVRSVQSSL